MVLTVLLAGLICFSTGCRKKSSALSNDTMSGILGETDTEQAMFGPRPGSLKILADIQVENVLFDYDSAQIQAAERFKLEMVADYLKHQNPKAGVIIEGHCDERGSAEYNLALGERRALAARAYLIGLGVDGDAIQTRSLGKEVPLDAGHDESAWRLNRRDEFVFFER
ncbi:MAG: OmpA family protein [Lentisphaerae bacterium]|nr:OmpA family protein [Lentisphaerota bacterium]